MQRPAKILTPSERAEVIRQGIRDAQRASDAMHATTLSWALTYALRGTGVDVPWAVSSLCRPSDSRQGREEIAECFASHFDDLQQISSNDLKNRISLCS